MFGIKFCLEFKPAFTNFKNINISINDRSPDKFCVELTNQKIEFDRQ